MNRKLFIRWLYRIGIVLAVCTGIYIIALIAGNISRSSAEPENILPEKMSVSCSAKKNKVSIGQKASIDVSFYPENASAQLKFSSSAPDVISVDESGRAEALSLGSAVVTVSAEENSELKEKIKIKTCIPAPENITVSCAQDESLNAILKWNKVNDAQGYKVYRKIDDGEWVCLTDEPLTDTKFVDKNTVIQAANSYKLMSIAEEKRYNSGFSNPITMTIPLTPYGTKISSITDDGIEYYWKKPADVKGYEVYRSYEQDEGYTKIVNIPARKINTYLDNKFNKKKTEVYYKIRSYSIDESGNKVFSAMSEPSRAKYLKRLKLDEKKIFVRSGVKHYLKAYIGWGYASGVKWKSSDTSVAEVSSKGTVIGKKAGKCEIFGTMKVGKHTQKVKCEVMVDRKPMSKLSNAAMVYTQDENGVWNSPKHSEGDSALIMMTGDMMCTGSQQAVQGFETGNYNFNESYDEMKDIVSDADFAIGNLETTLSSTWPYMHESAYINNYPNCNAPSRYLDAVVHGGFDGVSMANNHNCDAELQGLKETVDQVDRYGLAHTGVFKSKDDQRYMLINVNGIKLAYISYVSQETGFNNKDESWSKEQVDTHLNYFDEKKAVKDIAAAKKAGAEYVITFMHWGVKNVHDVTDDQKQTAQKLADAGADYIVGAHCHLVQEYTVLDSKDGRKVPCLYSMGDFQSSITQVPGNRGSVLLKLKLKRDENGKVVKEDDSYIPCFTLTNYKDKLYCTIPTDRKDENGNYVLKAYNKIHGRIVDSIGPKLREEHAE